MQKYKDIISFEYFTGTNSVSFLYESGIIDENGKKYKEHSKSRISFTAEKNTKKEVEEFLGSKDSKIYKIINVIWGK